MVSSLFKRSSFQARTNAVLKPLPLATCVGRARHTRSLRNVTRSTPGEPRQRMAVWLSQCLNLGKPQRQRYPERVSQRIAGLKKGGYLVFILVIEGLPSLVFKTLHSLLRCSYKEGAPTHLPPIVMLEKHCPN